MASWKERTSFNSKRSLHEDGSGELYEFKVVLVGTVGVGKTSVTCRYIKDHYREFVNPTIGASYMWRRDRIDDREVKFSIWDTAGMEQFHALVPMYFRDADAVILVVDVTRDTCAEEANLWLEKVKQSAPQSISVFLTLNKIDLETKRQFSLASAEALARSQNTFQMRCCEVSAKTGEGIHELFTQIGSVCLQKSVQEVLAANKKACSGPAPVKLTSPKARACNDGQERRSAGGNRCDKC